MSGLARSPEEWQSFLLRHLPPGDALDVREGSLLWYKFKALAQALARFDTLCAQLIYELDPRYTEEFITDWERMLDLPRSCQTPPTLLETRRAIVVALLTRAADISKATLIEAAAVIGYEITIKEYFPETVPGDLPLTNRFKYDVTIVSGGGVVTLFRAGTARAGDPLMEAEAPDLECLLDEVEPAYAERTILP